MSERRDGRITTSEKSQRNRPQNIPWEDSLWTAKGWAHMREEYTGYKTKDGIPGWGISDFTEFGGTSYAIKIPIKRRFTHRNHPGIAEELHDLNSERLRTEPFQDFYRHVDMLLTFGPNKQIEANIHTILQRSREEGPSFAKQVADEHVSALQARGDKRAGFEAITEWTEAQVYLRSMACLEICEEDPQFRLPQSTVKTVLYDALTYQPEFLRYAINFDERNKMYGESLGVAEKYKAFIAPLLLSKKKQDKAFVDSQLNWRIGKSQFLGDILTYSLQQTEKEKELIAVVQKLAPLMGVEKLRKKLREYVSDNGTFKPKFDAIFHYLGFDPVTDARVDLRRDIYERINFSEYKPNEETITYEVDLLKEQCPGNTRVLDVACGTGRHLTGLDGQGGREVVGVDLVPKHIAAIKEASSESTVVVGSWFSLPFPDNSFDSAYCLGRSFMHNTTLPDAVACLQEMNRVTTDTGVVIMDLPDTTVGEYKKARERTEKIAKQRGISKFLPGLIMDSPDLTHYFDRYAPSDRAFVRIAQFAGWYADKVATKTYNGVSGETDKNNYWKLTKMRKDVPPMTPWDVYYLFNEIYERPNLPSEWIPMPDQTMLAW